jgi:hypothetical protein
MNENCPVEISACAELCEKRWAMAVIRNSVSGPCDNYKPVEAVIDLTDSELQCSHVSAEFSHDALTALDEHLRRYVLVDACEGCGDELGEQAYNFICPLKVKK